MYELVATNTKMGVFELELEKKSPFPLNLIMKLGPYKGRAVGMIGVVFSLLFSMNAAPAKFFMEQNWAASEEVARQIQYSISNVILFTSCVIYALVFLFRKQVLSLQFDRPRKECSIFHIPLFRFSPLKEELAMFQDIEKIEVFSKNREPLSPHGYIKIVVPKFSKKFREISFQFLSDDQFNIYPQNLGQITGRDPKGDISKEEA